MSAIASREAAREAAPASRRAPGRVARVDGILVAVALAALWAICHPYSGIVTDAGIYIGRVLADLDPAGLGRDLMFANDGQSRFSAFPVLARPLVAVLGASPAALAIAAVASACWFAALVALARALAPGQLAWALVFAVAVLPVDYGEPHIFAFAETNAVPRPFAEAAVMAALAAVLVGRVRLAAVLLVAAVLIHPVMALAGLGVAAVLLAPTLVAPRPAPTHVSDQAAARPLRPALAGLALAGAVVFAWRGAALIPRLGERLDPVWSGYLVERSPYLFPSLWSAEAWARLAIHAGTLLVAVRVAPPPMRRLALAVLTVGVAALAVALVFGDGLGVVLIVQMQLWRVTWLVAAAAGCALAASVQPLWGIGPGGRAVVALLALAWLGDPPLPAALAIVLVAVLFSAGTGARALPRGIAAAILSVVVVVVLAEWVIGLIGYVGFVRALPAGAPVHLADALRNKLHVAPLGLVAGWWLLATPRRIARSVPLAAAAALLLALGAAALWDQRTRSEIVMQSPWEPAGLAALGAGRAPEVLWLDGMREAWFTLGRQQYFSVAQAASSLFSRALAVQWHRRAEDLIALGLARRWVLTPLAPMADDALHVTQTALDALCHRPDAPGLVILPLEAGGPVPSLRGMTTWPLLVPYVVAERHPEHDVYRSIAALGVLPCGAAGPTP